MTNSQCKIYENCSAPFCPLNKQSLEAGVWYPDEEICRSKTHGKVLWIKMQRKIKKATKDNDKYFTLSMLKRNCIVRKGIKGLDPDKEKDDQLKQWMKKHPEKKELSEIEKRELKKRFEAAKKRCTHRDFKDKKMAVAGGLKG